MASSRVEIDVDARRDREAARRAAAVARDRALHAERLPPDPQLAADLDAELREQRRIDPGARRFAQRPTRCRGLGERARLECDLAVEREGGVDRAQLDQPRALAGAGHREQHHRARSARAGAGFRVERGDLLVAERPRRRDRDVRAEIGLGARGEGARDRILERVERDEAREPEREVHREEDREARMVPDLAPGQPEHDRHVSPPTRRRRASGSGCTPRRAGRCA